MMTMLENWPWPELVLGIAAGLAILVVYDVAYVWPIWRRIRALNERCAALEQELTSLPKLAARVAALADRGRDDLTRLGERLGQLELATDAHSYEQAIVSAERGEDALRLKTCFGLTEAEAALVTLLHGAQRRAGEDSHAEAA